MVYLPTVTMKITPNVGKYTSPMGPMGYQDIKIRASNMYGNSYWKRKFPRKHFQL